MAKMKSIRFTPTQRRIMMTLSDGQMHNRHELLKCIGDDLATLSNLQIHISMIRKLLKEVNQTIVCELYYGVIGYRHVKLL